jgi:glycine cleavage system H lipoate-binding protein
MPPVNTDLFATKGAEYLLVIGFLIALIVYWRFLARPVRSLTEVAPGREAVAGPSRWFSLPRQLFYHPGHSWAFPGPDGLVTVGIDDFAQKLMGKATAVDLPQVGQQVEQGERGVGFCVHDGAIDLLSPVDGEVVALNEELTGSPDLVNEDPYGRGWLMKIRPTRLKPNLTSLLSERLATAWMETSEAALRHRIYGDLGIVMQDGGTPVTGIARSMSEDNWEEMVREFLLTL